jgi:hypothetical protein
VRIFLTIKQFIKTKFIMKKLNFFTLLVLLSFLTLYCKKQIDSSQEKAISQNEYSEERDLILSAINTTADLFALQTTDVSVEQGLLNFKDSATLNRVLASISLLEADSAFYHDYKSSIGVFDNSPKDDEYPYMAAYHAFSQRFSNFYTYYEKVENDEVAFLENGGSPGDIPVNDIDDEDLQVILNQYKEVKIGNLIYKYLNEDQFYVITANDFSQLPVLRSLVDPFSAKQLKNTRLIDTRVKEDLVLYKKIVDGSNSDNYAPCEASLQTFMTAPNTYMIVNTSRFYNCSQQNISWTITDGNSNILYTTSGTEYFSYTIPANPVLPVKVTVTVSGTCCTDSEQVTLLSASSPGSGPCNDNLGFSLSIKDYSSNGETYLFEINALSTSGIGNYNVTWNYGDGSPTELKTNVASASHHYVFADGIMTYTVKALITWGNGCSQEVILTFEAGCGVYPIRVINILFDDSPFDGNYSVRLLQKMKSNGEKFKTTMTFYKKNSNGNFRRERASSMKIDMTLTKIMGNCIPRSTSSPFTSQLWNVKHKRFIKKNKEMFWEVDRIGTKPGLTTVRFTVYHLGQEKPFDMTLLE